MIRRIYFILTVIYIVISLVFTFLIISSSRKYKTIKEEQAKTLDYQNRLLNSEEWVNGNLKVSWGMLDIIDSRTTNFSDGNDDYSKKIYDRSFFYMILFFVTSIIFISIIVLFFRKLDFYKNAILLSLLIVATISLIGGLFSPMIEITAFKNDLTVAFEFKKLSFTKEFPGKTVFYYQSKSIIELIRLLFFSKNVIVAVSILIFSVFLPTVKLCLSFIALLKEEILENKIINFMIQKIGKWSMADVFVVAVYLAYLSFNNFDAGVTTQSNTLAGLFLFVNYCILSLISSMFVNRYNRITYQKYSNNLQ